MSCDLRISRLFSRFLVAMSVRDRVAGVLLGIAAGDRNRGPMRMAWRLSCSLLEQKKYDADDIWRRYDRNISLPS